ncbi:DNA (cytosine-5-)-methyltransferase [Campylobacter sp. MIT 99-7217]|uniref:DNA (cytosine-5-)-methyltransferase n=1 Tax=Campylobacter sp. MIT 99-7217 TaxID=535091 RepID=UPI00115A2C54|nr:DNA (cytosine-5-)-methyltransferase [Campylobacter sp. MIT 99-7217]TQR34598.1 DNA (cytosine-5-)-methyltransferase [Campylobacter sp. MIT 99-7217]
MLNFIDLFAGVGGFHLAIKQAYKTFNNNTQKLKCIFASEIDINASKTYALNFPNTPLFGDITDMKNQNKIAKDFDILCAGFPCQAFSIAGYQRGFKDTRGTLFFEIAKIAKKHKPKVLLLENVKNLKTHDNGNTFKIIKTTLTNLGYVVYYDILNSATHANIPQNRERIFIVAFDTKEVKNHKDFTFPQPIKLAKTIHSCLDLQKQDDIFYYTPKSKYYDWLVRDLIKKDTIYQLRRIYVRENKSNLCPTLTANMGTGGHNVPLIKDDFGIRKLTPRECFNFQGYPPSFKLPDIANSKLYMQAGNSITLPLVTRVVENIFKVLV